MRGNLRRTVALVRAGRVGRALANIARRRSAGGRGG